MRKFLILLVALTVFCAPLFAEDAGLKVEVKVSPIVKRSERGHLLHFSGQKVLQKEFKNSDFFGFGVVKNGQTESVKDAARFEADMILTNISDHEIKLSLWGCSKYDQIVSDNPDVLIGTWGCFKNGTNLINIEPHESINLQFILGFLPEAVNGKYTFRLGFENAPGNSNSMSRDYYKSLGMIEPVANDIGTVWSDKITVELQD